jgi:hypothetical protein
MPWREDKQAWEYPIESYGICWHSDDTQEALDECVRMLPLYVPGLKVVGSELTERTRRNPRRGCVWFTWSRDAMWERYEELFKQYGVADERLAFEECSGIYVRRQPSLPGTIYTEPRVKASFGGISGWTRNGLMAMERAFIHRICSPNKGGPEASASSSLRCEVGDSWWLVGTRGDSPEVLDLEIQASPLEPHVKENLLYNLHTRNGQVPQNSQASAS